MPPHKCLYTYSELFEWSRIRTLLAGAQEVSPAPFSESVSERDSFRLDLNCGKYLYAHWYDYRVIFSSKLHSNHRMALSVEVGSAPTMFRTDHLRADFGSRSWTHCLYMWLNQPGGKWFNVCAEKGLVGVERSFMWFGDQENEVWLHGNASESCSQKHFEVECS